MSELYFQYIKEREGLENFHNFDGFITFGITGKTCFIKEIYVQQSARLKGVGLKLFKKVIQRCIEKKVSVIFCNVDTRALNYKDSLAAIQSQGFQVMKQDGPVIFLALEMKEYGRRNQHSDGESDGRRETEERELRGQV